MAVRSIVALFAALLFALPAAAEEGVLRIVLGYPAGATSDILSRLLADKLHASLGRPVVVENKVGAGGRIANDTVKAAAADGNTLLLTPVASMAIFPHSYAGRLRYDPFKDFVPVAHLSNFQLGFGVGAAVPAKTLAEYVAAVKKDPKLGFYASAAPGSIPHFFGVMFARAAGIELTHVPYKGTAHALQGLAGGQVSAVSTVAADIGTLVTAGKARLLAVSGEKRMSIFPDVPTFREAGYDLVALPWYALFARTGTPQADIDKYSKAAIAAMHEPVLRARLEKMGLEPTGLGPQELAKILKHDYEQWGPVIRASGFKPGQ
ncbi:MAG TPA: tripartite tricarboxylate transporter substrate-binding protein [Burkholderiales bacterium]|nr:tripartite tricarboxylate transporter substrate-binding protein [Burkholderiales bacterium]